MLHNKIITCCVIKIITCIAGTVLVSGRVNDQSPDAFKIWMLTAGKLKLLLT